VLVLPGLKLFVSNRLEKLVSELAMTMRSPLSSPMEKDIIVVQSKGMERWLSMEIARHNGIWANFKFFFPNAFVSESFRNIIPDQPEGRLFEPEIMTWRIARILPSLIDRPGFEFVRNYLASDTTGLKLAQLSEKIADTFDQYMIYRPEMIIKWEKEADNHWQPVLFRELLLNTDDKHRAAMFKESIEFIKKHPGKVRLPGRVSIFGISSLPRFHLELFAAFAQVTRINLFLVNPCREYWGDILAEHDIKKTALKQAIAPGIIGQDMYLSAGNNLLASMGKLGRDFFEMVNEFPCEEQSDFEDDDDESLLAIIQSDILNLRDTLKITGEKRSFNPNDNSIRVHSCHSPMREMEVLYDQLLNMFEKDPALKPRDIIVMAPDIEVYTPFIQTVFGSEAEHSRRISFSIADRSLRNTNKIIDTFFQILELGTGRQRASEVLGILESEPVLRRFGLGPDDLDLISEWIKQSGIRWGISGQGRLELGLPGYEENTWRAGLDRLVLGYALPGRDEKIFEGILPFDNIEGGDVRILGRFVEFTEKLFGYLHFFNRPRSLDEWVRILTALLDDLFLPDEDSEGQVQMIRGSLNELGAIKSLSGFSASVDIRVVNWNMTHLLEKDSFGGGFINGGVTFCAMLPMRSIPFKVICLLGMDNASYPREANRPEFDLIAKNPRPGDRSRRNDDRYLFLESLLSAREKVYISYIGQSIRDNSAMPPSVLVTELLDYIERGFEISGKKILEQIVTKHRLQAFNPEYFKKETDLFSYSVGNFRTAQASLGSRKNPQAFISDRLSDPDEDWKKLDIETLERFFSNPVRFLFERRLGIYLGKEITAVEDLEPLELSGLDQHTLRRNIFEFRLKGRDFKDIFAIIRAMGILPHGRAGEYEFERSCRGVDEFIANTVKHLAEGMLDQLEIDFNISGFNLTGIINNLYPSDCVNYRYAAIRPRDRVLTWIRHIILNTVRPEHYPLSSVLIGLGRDNQEWRACRFRPVADARLILENLLQVYWEGLTRPVHFFQKSAWEYFQIALNRKKTEEDALDKARLTWTGSKYNPGEGDDLYYKACFRDIDPLDTEFKRLSELVLRPCCENMEEVEAWQ
jgi:exodeoxyribonuclease V gamma subunit